VGGLHKESLLEHKVSADHDSACVPPAHIVNREAAVKSALARLAGPNP
jgi:hypothetical protein